MTTAEFNLLPLGDARLIGLEWGDDGDVRLSLWPAGTESDKLIVLLCRWSTDVRINLDFGNLSGPPLLWEAHLAVLETKRWRLVLDFGGSPSGAIELECNGVELIRG